MNPFILNDQIITPALRLMGSRFDSPLARTQMIAIALQESGLQHRTQQPNNGPARSWWQFERMGGVIEVLTHPVTAPIMRQLCAALRYDFDSRVLHLAMADNDLLAASMARLLIFIDPRPLPTVASDGWDQYKARWRPGKPRPATWIDNWKKAADAVKEQAPC